MHLETVVDLVIKHFPNKIIICTRDKLLFKGDLIDFNRINDLDNLIVDKYEYIDRENKTMLIRVLEE